MRRRVNRRRLGIPTFVLRIGRRRVFLEKRRLGPQLDHHPTRHPYVGSERRRYERTSLELVGRVLVGEALSVELFRRTASEGLFPRGLVVGSSQRFNSTELARLGVYSAEAGHRVQPRTDGSPLL